MQVAAPSCQAKPPQAGKPARFPLAPRLALFPLQVNRLAPLSCTRGPPLPQTPLKQKLEEEKHDYKAAVAAGPAIAPGQARRHAPQQLRGCAPLQTCVWGILSRRNTGRLYRHSLCQVAQLRTTALVCWHVPLHSA